MIHRQKSLLSWHIKHFDDQTLDHIRSRFDKDSGKVFMGTLIQLQNEAIKINNLKKSYGAHVVLDGLDFCVQ